MQYIHVERGADLIKWIADPDVNPNKVKFEVRLIRELCLSKPDKTCTRAELIRHLVPHYIPVQVWKEAVKEVFLLAQARKHYIQITKETPIVVSIPLDEEDNNWVFHAHQKTMSILARVKRNEEAKAALDKHLGTMDMAAMAKLLKISLEEIQFDYRKIRRLAGYSVISDWEITLIGHYFLSKLTNKKHQRKIFKMPRVT